MEVKEALIPSSTKKGFLLKLFNVHVPTGSREFREHRHIEFEIVLFKSGSGIYKTSNKGYSIEANDIFLFSSNEVHCITEISGEEEMVLMNIHFEPRFIWSSGNDLFDSNYLKIFFDRNKNFENRLDRNNPAVTTIKTLLLNMEQEFFNKSSEYALMVKAQLLTILVTLIRHFDYVKTKDDTLYVVKNNFEMIERSMDYINEHFTDSLTLDELAKIANMSSTYYSAIFKKLNGISPWDYITAKRVELAMKHLRSEACTMLDLALKCGFNNTANFNRAFKKFTNETPTEYKNSYKLRANI